MLRVELRLLRLGCAASLTVFGAFGAASPVEPQLPSTYLDTTMPASAGSCTINLVAGDDLQGAIDRAKSGDTICLQAGGRFVGNYILRAKAGTGWTTIRSAQLDSLPAGVRVGPSQIAYLATISTKNVAPAVDSDPGANFWRLSGLELTVEPSLPSNLNYGLALGYQGNGAETTVAQLPTDIVFDRDWIHGATACNCKRGVTFNGIRLAVVDSTISDIHTTNQDTQAIVGWNGTGPYKIVNNDLEASGENIMFGGSDPANPSFVASDIEIRGNYFFKPLTWNAGDPSYGGIHWMVKNSFEIKMARRVLIDGNIFENSWVDGQDGVAISIKSSMQGDKNGCAPCSTTDITFSNNIIRGAAEGIALVGQEGPGGANGIPGPLRGARITFTNVLVYPLPGYLFSFVVNNSYQPIDYFGEFQDVQISHFTGLVATTIAKIDPPTPAFDSNSPNFVVKDSILERHLYGFGAGSTEGKGLLDSNFVPYTWDHVLLLNTSGIQDSNAYLVGKYPAGTIVVDGYGALANYSGGNADYHGYSLAPNSPYIGAASDGTNIGVNFSALDAATANAQYGGRSLLRAPSLLVVQVE